MANTVHAPKTETEQRAVLNTLDRKDLLQLLRSVHITAHKLTADAELVNLIVWATRKTLNANASK